MTDDHYVICLRKRIEGEKDDKEENRDRYSMKKSYLDFESLHDNLFNSYRDIKLPQLPSNLESNKGHRSQELRDYLEELLTIPCVVRSEPLTNFFCAENDSNSIRNEPVQHMYLDYLLPNSGSTDLVYYNIPFTNSPTNDLQNGWWVIWKFRIEEPSIIPLDLGGHNVEFSLFIDQSENRRSIYDDGEEISFDSSTSTVESEEDEGGITQELVRRELCSASSTDWFSGSYRCPPDVSGSSRVTFNFTEVRSLPLPRFSSPRLQFEYAFISHESFSAACEAAREQNEADERRQKAPLLFAILNMHSSSSYLSVEPLVKETIQSADNQKEEAFENQQGKKNINAAELPGHIGEELHQLREEVSALQKEKHAWVISKDEMQRELDRLSAKLTTEQEEKERMCNEVDAAKKDSERLQTEVNLLKCQLLNEDQQRKKELENIESEASEMKKTSRELKNEVDILTAENNALEGTIRELKKLMKDQGNKARSEIDTARMQQRILEGKVRHLEQELRKSSANGGNQTQKRKGNNNIRPVVSSGRRNLDPNVASYQHPNERINTQLNALRERHAQLSLLLQQNPNNAQNLELVSKIEKAIYEIVTSSNSGRSRQSQTRSSR